MLPRRNSAITIINKAFRVAREDKFKDNLRVGNASYYLEDKKKVFGGCQRIAVLRLHEVAPKVSNRSYLYFNTGVAIENELVNKLRSNGENVLTEDESRVFKQFNGVTVSGTPDAILPDRGYGIELKTINSLSTAVKILVKDKPKTDNIIQAATYSYFTQLPFYLLYYNSNSFMPDYQAIKEYEKPLQPEMIEYYLYWEDGSLWVNDNRTIVTPSGIENTWLKLTDNINNNILPPKVSMYDVYGERETGTSKCQYCAFKDICKEKITKLDEFVIKCKEVI